VLTFTV